jgi:putative two-component system response regulator
VLVVDDTPDNLALDERDPPPDLILLDIMMPQMDGYEVCKRLKQISGEHPDIPVIFLTARADESKTNVLGLELGAVDYITKPISPPIVLARVKAQLALKASRRFPARQERVPGAAGRASAHARCRRFRTSPSWPWPRWRKRATPTPATISAAPSSTCVRWREAAPPPAFRRLSDRLQYRSNAVQVGTLARHRQGRHSRPHPAQARALHAGGVRDHEDPHHARQRRHLNTPNDTLGATASSFCRMAKEIAYSHQEKWDGS